MPFVKTLGSGIVVLVILLVAGLILEGPLEIAIASASGPERIILIMLQVWPKLANLILEVLTRL